jgi:hypothetical protein
MSNGDGRFRLGLRRWVLDTLNFEFQLEDYCRLLMSDRRALLHQEVAEDGEGVFKLGLKVQTLTVELASEILGRLLLPAESVEPLTAYAGAVRRITHTLPEDPDLLGLATLRLAARVVIDAATVRCEALDPGGREPEARDTLPKTLLDLVDIVRRNHPRKGNVARFLEHMHRNRSASFEDLRASVHHGYECEDGSVERNIREAQKLATKYDISIRFRVSECTVYRQDDPA